MRFGFYLPNSGPTARPEPLAAIARKGDELGFYCMVAGDHILVPREINSPYPYTADGTFHAGGAAEYLEQLTLLTYLAGITHSIRLIPSVMIVPYRNPLLAAKILATLDVLSGGRLTLGVGVGWMEEEFEALDAPPFAERGAVTNEYLQAFKELWTSDEPSFEGKYCHFSNIHFLPKPVQRPHPPIWVGGQSRAAMRRAARLGDGWHPVGAIPAAPLEPEELAQNIELLHRYAEAAARNPEELEVSMKAPLYDAGSTPSGAARRRFSGESEQMLQDIQTYEDVGVSCIIFDIRGNDLNGSLERLEWFAEEVMSRS
ncbi:MAG: TIGR03619 family F420-dependent LLM class oxidoreductase [Chloroflexi bacterium]|nr:TIGR03619 family F420-dependent LLM class oxidoreductase [Chloroflexota bacterium]